MRRAPRTRPGTRLLAPALALSLGLLAGACSSDEAPDERRRASASRATRRPSRSSP